MLLSMIMSRFPQSLKRYLRYLAAGSVGQVINVCAQVIGIPLFLHFWSKPAYGEWLVLTSIPSLLWSFEGGLAGVASSRMIMATAREDWHQANVVFQNVFLAQSILCSCLLAGCLVFTHWIHVSGFLHLVRTPDAIASKVLTLMICYMIIGLFLSLLRAAYRASELEARGQMIFNCWRVLDLLVTVAVLTTGGHVIRLALGLVASAGVCLIFAFADMRRHCPAIRFGLKEVSRRDSIRLLIDGTPMLIGMAASAFSLQGYPLVVNRFLGSAAVVNLNVARTVSRITLQGIQLFSSSSSPELSRTFGRQDREGYLRLLRIIVMISCAAGVLSCIAMPLLGPSIIRLWTRGRVSIDALTLFLFGVTIALQGGWAICSTTLAASNRHHVFNYLYFVFTVLGLITAPVFMLHFGFRSVPAVMIFVDTSLLIAGILLARRKLTHVSLGDFSCVFDPSFYLKKAAAFREHKGISS